MQSVAQTRTERTASCAAGSSWCPCCASPFAPHPHLLPRITGVWVVVVVVVVVKEGLQEKSDAAADVLSKLCDDGGMCTGDRDPEMCDAGDKLLEVA